MSDNLRKNLTGQFAFLTEADRLSTLKNLKLGGVAVAATVTAGACPIDASLGQNFTATTPIATTFTITNLKDGQMIRVIVTNSNVGSITQVFTGTTGVIVATAAGKITSFAIFNVGGTIYLTQTLLS